MAKWGEGDPRWIVEERADATNVNNWHWTERDVSGWSEETLRRLLLGDGVTGSEGVGVTGSEGVCRVTEVSRLEGEASINNRKGKLIFFYEWQLKASWTGTTNSGIKYKGSLEVSNLSDENDPDDLDISVSLCKDQPNTPLLDLMKKDGVQKVRKVLGEYVTLLKSEFSQGMILPTADGISPAPRPAQSPAPRPAQSPAPRPAPSSTPSCSGVRIPTCSFSLKETFLTSPDELYRTFTNQEFVQVFTHAAAVVEDRRGGKFRLLDGNVSGEFTQLVPDEKIEMRWRFKTWPSEHHATVSLDLKDRGDETELRMECRGVPAAEEERTREGWRRYYFEAIKQTFGYGARLY
ncbi:activator of 90 kDa heat shock protein ATPase homolog 1-like isoform X2 [Centroberyx affinis]|uniref:activator of 90 kDa heat shock protein ATPase homolog 1-like isoform X2 n=1 Tax=Centroberyx affinis TaxID=166261 RepID=UPI003A5BF7B4